MKNGFITALGTPFDENNNFDSNSYATQIKLQLENNASGLLVMGSMGMQYTIRNKDYEPIVKTALEASKGKIPIFVGAMDNSCLRVFDRIESIKSHKIEGVVLTPTFYYKEKEEYIINFFKKIAKQTFFPIYIYDLPVVTQNPINIRIVRELMNHENIKGIKTANYDLCRDIMKESISEDQFKIFYSNLDKCDEGYFNGINNYLDGMFSCTPRLARKMQRHFSNNEYDKGKEELEKILNLRNIFVKYGVFESFSVAMNHIGCQGRFHPDYIPTITDEKIIAEIKNKIDEYEVI